MSKNCQKLDIFSKKLPKINIFFKKIAKVFGNFLTVKWQFSGGSASALAVGDMRACAVYNLGIEHNSGKTSETDKNSSFHPFYNTHTYVISNIFKFAKNVHIYEWFVH